MDAVYMYLDCLMMRGITSTWLLMMVSVESIASQCQNATNYQIPVIELFKK